MFIISPQMRRLITSQVEDLKPGVLRRVVGLGEKYVAHTNTINDPAYRRLFTITISDHDYDVYAKSPS